MSKQVKIKTTGKVVKLADDDFLFSGGQAEIYVKGSTVFKLYHNSDDCISEDKASELMELNRPNIIRPLDMLVHPRFTQDLGFTSAYAAGTIPLVKLTTGKFKRKNGITVDVINELAANMQETISFIHSKDCLIVDGNEMNYAVDSKSFDVVYFFDIDSYKTRSFGPDAYHPATRDYTLTDDISECSTLSDWYGHAIVLFRIFVGIHPYGGSHPNFSKGDIVGRMKAGISVLNKDVSLPPSVKGMNQIPKNYLDWFKYLFIEGLRAAPPGIAGATQVLQINLTTLTNSGRIVVKPFYTYEGEIINVYDLPGNHFVVTTTNHKYVDNVERDQIEIGTLLTTLSDSTNIVVQSRITPNQDLDIVTSNKTTKRLLIRCRDQFLIEGFLFVITRNTINYIELRSALNRVIPSVKKLWKFLPNSTQVLTGLLYSDVLGSPHLYIPYFSKIHKGIACSISKFPELFNFRILDGKRDKTVIMLSVHDGTDYYKCVFKFNEEFSVHTFQKIRTDVASSLNFVVLSSGIVVHITDDGTLEAFPSKIGNNKVTEIRDNLIDSSMQLFTIHGKVYFSDGNELKQLSLSKK